MAALDTISSTDKNSYGFVHVSVSVTLYPIGILPTVIIGVHKSGTYIGMSVKTASGPRPPSLSTAFTLNSVKVV